MEEKLKINENLTIFLFKALLRFSSWPFEVCDRIQPCALRLSRPFFNVESTILGGLTRSLLKISFFSFMVARYLVVSSTTLYNNQCEMVANHAKK